MQKSMKVTAAFENDNFRILDVLDEKEEHTTYLVRKKQGSRLYVRKEVSPEVYETSRRREGIGNKHLVPLDHTYTDAGKYYIVEPYVSGRTIAELLEEKGTFPIEEASEIVAQILDGLCALHKKGIVHRDITPRNLILSDDGVVKILDFGISRTKDPDKSHDPRILGTEGYAAPEQFGFMQTDGRTDLYAVGVLYNVLLTGMFPSEKMTEHKQAASVIKKALAMDPKVRWESAYEMQNALPCGRTSSGNSARLLVKEPFFYKFPGFRSNTKWKKIVGGVVYGTCLFFLIIIVLGTVSGSEYYRNTDFLAGILLFVAFPLIAGNYLYWDMMIPGLRQLQPWMRFMVRCMVSSVIFAFAMELLSREVM